MRRGNVNVNGVDYILDRLLMRGASSVYKAVSEDGVPVVLKMHDHGKQARAFSRGTKTHYGITREVSELVFNEIVVLQNKLPFLVKFLARGKVKSQWVLVMEFCRGSTLFDFLLNGIADWKLEVAVKTLGEELKLWHSNGVALGDPNLKNAVVSFVDGCSVRFIDYNHLHHPSFHYCKKLGCYSVCDRFTEDLDNSGLLGHGFVKELSLIGMIRNVKANLTTEELETLFKVRRAKGAGAAIKEMDKKFVGCRTGEFVELFTESFFSGYGTGPVCFNFLKTLGL